jgi:hypothetical protein
MSVDLKNNSMFKRSSLVLNDDCLITLEHERTQDRVRKIMFNRVESVIIWRAIPWLPIVLLTVLLGLPSIGVFLINETASTIIASILLAFVLAVIIAYLYCGRTTIRIIRGSQPQDISGIFRPGRLRRFRDRLIANIHQTQQNLLQNSPAAPDQPPLLPSDMPTLPPISGP